MQTHPKKTRKIDVSVANGKIVVDPECIYARCGDTVKWKLDKKRGFAIIVKAFEGPFEHSYKAVKKGTEWISVKVRPDAKPGVYSYAVVAIKDGGKELLVADPEIIIPPPDRC